MVLGTVGFLMRMVEAKLDALKEVTALPGAADGALLTMVNGSLERQGSAWRIHLLWREVDGERVYYGIGIGHQGLMDRVMPRPPEEDDVEVR